MTREAQNVFLNKEYAEAVRYMDNAKELLQKAQKADDGRYRDKKYVRSACGVAYSGVLVALDAWLKIKGVENTKKSGRKSVDFYKFNISQLDKKMADDFDNVYGTLHLLGYYDGNMKVKTIQSGFEDAYEIISKIKPEHPIEIKPSAANNAKRFINKMLMLLTTAFK